MLNKQIFFTDVHKAELLENKEGKLRENEVLVKSDILSYAEKLMGMNNTLQKFSASLRCKSCN